jgi:BirA family transcriptional regulator, biotin operon repressor / biotin---[acetyl-CoA-carboxylase] ligase
MIGQPFIILQSTDSTNNYAMGLVQHGMAQDGCVVFAHHQTAGKGQRGRSWISEPNQNITLSVVLEPPLALHQQFILSMFTAHCICDWLEKEVGIELRIKWPNDLYWRDRKAGGILIENQILGQNWQFAVIGIGINLNQVQFPTESGRPVSLRQITGKSFDPLDLSYQLCDALQRNMHLIQSAPWQQLVKSYNQRLYKRGELVKIRYNQTVFETQIVEVDVHGRLHTQDVIKRDFAFGTVEWLFA